MAVPPPSANTWTLPKKVAFITGASSGIALATAHLLLFPPYSYNVFGVDISPSPTTLASHPSFHFHQCNLLNPTSAADAVKACITSFGRVDALLNVAGIASDNFCAADTVQDDVWEKLMGINLTVPMRLIREVVPLMRRQGGGSIVNVTSFAGSSGASMGVAYTASKHGLVGLTKHTAWRFKDEGIRCNAVSPGVVVSTGLPASIDFQNEDKTAREIMSPVLNLHLPNGRSEPDDIAVVICFLASDAAKKLNGAIIPVDHAWSTIS